MSTQITIEGRLVQGGVVLKQSKDMKTKLPKKDDQGNLIEECYMGIAVPKKITTPQGQVIDNPQIATYWAAFDAEARANFPHLHPNGGNCTHPRFANKWQDGDGTDSNGKSVADKPGFAGHWIIGCNTRYAPACYARDSHGNLVQITDPEKIIKRGFRVAVGVTITGNGVEPSNTQAVPGLFVSPNVVLFVAPDTEIVSGPDPNAAFAGIAAQNGLATGVGVTGGAAPNLNSPPLPGGGPAGSPPLPGGGPATAPAVSSPPMPGNAPVAAQPYQAGPASPAAGNPPMPGGTPAPAVPGAGMYTGPVPPAAAQPQYMPTPSAQGASVQNMLDAGWTIDALLTHGYIVRTM